MSVARRRKGRGAGVVVGTPSKSVGSDASERIGVRNVACALANAVAAVCFASACFVSACLVSACLANGGRGVPLYPVQSERPPVEEVAQLSGYVQSVNGREVSRYGSLFELLPGCHLVVTPTEWGEYGASQGGLVMYTGAVLFAVDMRAGYSYSVILSHHSLTGPTERAGSIQVRELDSEGNIVRTIGPGIHACVPSSEPEADSERGAGPAVDFP